MSCSGLRAVWPACVAVRPSAECSDNLRWREDPVSESFNTVWHLQTMNLGTPLEACVFCPAQLLKRIRDFGLDLRSTRSHLKREVPVRPFCGRHGREADGPQDQLRPTSAPQLQRLQQLHLPGGRLQSARAIVSPMPTLCLDTCAPSTVTAQKP